jgi:hypothetical protein
MQRVKMIKTVHGRNDNETSPQNFMAGGTYDVGPLLLSCLIDLGAVELVLPELETKPEPVKRGRRATL